MNPDNRNQRGRTSRLSKARLAEMIEGTTVDAFGESEQTTGWFTMIENLAVPFETNVLDMAVVVERVDLEETEHIVAICKRGRLSASDADPRPSASASDAAGGRRLGARHTARGAVAHGKGSRVESRAGSGGRRRSSRSRISRRCEVAYATQLNAGNVCGRTTPSASSPRRAWNTFMARTSCRRILPRPRPAASGATSRGRRSRAAEAGGSG